MYHLTKCNCCDQLVSISNGFDKVKLIVGEWEDFRRNHGNHFYRVFPEEPDPVLP